ncbi:5'-3' exoribonuclease 2 [Apostasia shenzhenica]|uniref:5'-3' exoribonuclease 2 n=1 Tax=Apostasia shenzhenica TaxID=1088818 RepID=A0A2I0BC70_9ASPA|nr:5'-3' exoribonuclease 2 [Apostasia shenzhenica]
MGVPSFYRWLVGKYPKIVVSAIDEGESCDGSQPNPNGEYDNLYLDMNGIIHPCFHPEDELIPPSTFDEVFIAIFRYIDRLFRIVRPRKLLFLAVDGVAPRAKMNQQRMRRFRAAKDAELAEMEEKRLRAEFKRQGKELLPMLMNSDVSDPAVITPGTVFMQKLSKALEYYIRLRLSNDAAWKNIKVILSDANAPGEGEHKVVSFIRQQRSLPSYDHNTRHCLYGLDADLIMLALATHEIHFSILREDTLTQHYQQDSCLATFVANAAQKEELLFKSRQWFKKVDTTSCSKPKQMPYQFLNIWTLREYLELDMKPLTGSSIDFERIVDDFVCICFFTGNDFIPHLPSLEIHEGAIDLLVAVYKETFKHMKGYFVDTARMQDKQLTYINLKCVEMFITKVGSYEDSIFDKRYKLKQKKLQRLSQEMSKSYNDEDCDMQRMGNLSITDSENLANFFSENCDLLGVAVDGVSSKSVKLGRPGWKSRYYEEKFSSSEQMDNIRRIIVEKYVEGLCWVLQYYYSGVCSWSWYYPFYYGPFASDLRNLASVKVTFKIGRPFKPFDQLMAVLPPRSCHALPTCFRNLMIEEESPIIDFYPKDFTLDLDGKRFTWQGICKLPFVDENRLLGAIKMLNVELQCDEILRNGTSEDRIFTVNTNPLADQSRSLEGRFYETQKMIAIGDVEGCAPYFNPEPDVHFVPKLLDKVILPEKTITEEDAVERKLWHDCWGPWPQTIERPRLIVMGEGSRSTLPSTAKETWKGGGCGWSSAGRGREDSAPASVNCENDTSTRFLMGKERGSGSGRGRFDVGRGRSENPRSIMGRGGSRGGNHGRFEAGWGRREDPAPESANTEHDWFARSITAERRSRGNRHGGFEASQWASRADRKGDDRGEGCPRRW